MSSSSRESRNHHLADVVAARDTALRLACLNPRPCFLLLGRGQDRLVAGLAWTFMDAPLANGAGFRGGGGVLIWRAIPSLRRRDPDQVLRVSALAPVAMGADRSLSPLPGLPLGRGKLCLWGS